VTASFGEGVTVHDCGPLEGGLFAAVWWVALDDGRQVVVKVAPPREVPVLAYEQGLMTAEAEYFQLAREYVPEVPVPEVLHHGLDVELDAEWLVLSHLAGTGLPELRSTDRLLDDRGVKHEVGVALARLHSITGPRFGYSGDRPHAATWAAALAAMIDSLLDDARAWHVQLDSRPQRIRDVVAAKRALLNEIKTPVLLHFDLWDGNVLATADAAGRASLSGIVDGERYMFGDPLVDFVSPGLLSPIDEPGHPFRAGYAMTAGIDLLSSPSALMRLALYRLHLHLLMVVEMPSRGEGGAEHDHKRKSLLAQLDDQLARLERD
jgi:aminoglycoside phosphotransferase (APT) family kinase protein